MIINAKLTMVILFPTLLILGYVLWTGGKLSKVVTQTLEEKNRMNRVAYSAIDHYPVIRVYDAKEFLQENYDKALERWGRAEIKKDRLYALCNSLSGVLSFLPLLLLLVAGVYMVVTREIMIGTLIFFLSLQKSVTVFIMNMPMWIANFKNFIVNLSRIDVA
jgi:ABC-type bacteriocin/lantibiotic exporter with double-glycine peptidase domain